MLTSMVKRVDVAVADAFASAMDGSWAPGLKVLGLSEDGVDWALDENNRQLVSKDMEQELAAAEQAIVSGQVTVADFTANNSCDY